MTHTQEAPGGPGCLEGCSKELDGLTLRGVMLSSDMSPLTSSFTAWRWIFRWNVMRESGVIFELSVPCLSFDHTSPPCVNYTQDKVHMEKNSGGKSNRGIANEKEGCVLKITSY